MDKYSKLKSFLHKIEESIDLAFNNKEILLLSFIHSSYANEHKFLKGHNERLEFLGDSVLNFIVSSYLYDELSTYSEGKLSYLRSILVNVISCAKYYKILNLQDYLLLGKGEQQIKRGKETIFADAFEAFMGAIYLDKGFDVAKEFLIKNFENYFKQVIEHPDIDYKSQLQHFTQKIYHNQPKYKLLKIQGPEHQKVFHMVVIINNEEIAHGIGSSKKQAEQIAAKKAFKKLYE